MYQFFIAFDQLINTLIYIKGDGFGKADETLSARAWRLRKVSATAYKIIDGIFFWQEDHCRDSYYAEVNRKQLPSEYQQKDAAYGKI